MGEYSKYNVNELLEMTLADDEESMRTIATGWVNTGSVLGTAKEALRERLEQLRGVWTAPSFGVFEEFINNTIARIDVAQTQADNRAEAAGKIATTAGWARDGVGEQYQEYIKASTKNLENQVVELPGGIKVPNPNPFNDSPTEEEVRKPFDNQARKIMSVALEEYQDQKPAMTQEVVPFRPVDEPNEEWLPPGGDDWGSDGISGSNASDTAALSATSYGSNALGSQGPTLQSGGTVPTTTSPVAGGGIPTAPTGGGPPLGAPPVGGLPPGSKPPTAPPKLPTGPATNARNTLIPRGASPASRTPGLPPQRSNVVRPSGGANGRGANGGRSGTVPGRTGRGLQKSQMAPKDLTQRVRPSGDVIGRRNTNSKPATETQAKPAARRLQPSVVRGAKPSAKQPQGRTAPVDNTKRGYTSRVINPRNRISEAAGHSRTPFVGKKMKHIPNPEPIGKRPEPETGASRARREIDAFRAERAARKKQQDGLSRPVIDNGLTNTANIHNVAPSQRDAVKAEESFWQPAKGVVDPVIGKRNWDPDAFEHDPGPVFNPRQAHVEDLDARLSRLDDPGPTAFGPKRKPETTNWPGNH